MSPRGSIKVPLCQRGEQEWCQSQTWKSTLRPFNWRPLQTALIKNTLFSPQQDTQSTEPFRWLGLNLPLVNRKLVRVSVLLLLRVHGRSKCFITAMFCSLIRCNGGPLCKRLLVRSCWLPLRKGSWLLLCTAPVMFVILLWCPVLNFYHHFHPQSSRRPNLKELNNDTMRYQRWLLNNCKAFYTSVIAEDLRQGTQYLLQVCETCVWVFINNYSLIHSVTN